MRTVPDVAMIASPNFPGVFIFDDGHCISGSGCGSDTPTLAILGGTSLAAPVWSGISKLIMQKNGGVRLGNLDTKIYNLASSHGVSDDPAPAPRTRGGCTAKINRGSSVWKL